MGGLVILHNVAKNIFILVAFAFEAILASTFINEIGLKFFMGLLSLSFLNQDYYDADFLTSVVRSLALIFQTCETFQLCSSLKLNLEKSEACWIGAKRGSKKPQLTANGLI